MTLKGDDVVGATLLKPSREEYGTSPTPEEEATLLGKVELPQVPKTLEAHELVHPAEQIAASAASPWCPPSQPSHLPSQKTKKSQQEIKVGITSAGQWVHAYLEENNRVPKWWRESGCLLQHHSNSPI